MRTQSVLRQRRWKRGVATEPFGRRVEMMRSLKMVGEGVEDAKYRVDEVWSFSRSVAVRIKRQYKRTKNEVRRWT
jgi:hypothetical protein